jgi:hypothetical protein
MPQLGILKNIFILVVGRCCEQCRQESVLPVSMPIPEAMVGKVTSFVNG